MAEGAREPSVLVMGGFCGLEWGALGALPSEILFGPGLVDEERRDQHGDAPLLLEDQDIALLLEPVILSHHPGALGISPPRQPGRGSIEHIRYPRHTPGAIKIGYPPTGYIPADDVPKPLFLVVINASSVDHEKPAADEPSRVGVEDLTEAGIEPRDDILPVTVGINLGSKGHQLRADQAKTLNLLWESGDE